MPSDLLGCLLISLLVLHLKVAVGSSWYRGCFTGNVTPHPPDGGVSRSPTECAAICYKTEFPYAAVHNDQSCGCLREIPEETSSQCNRCYGFPKLYCGFDQSKALYKTDGPYLLSATLHVPNAANLRVHENVPIQISVTYAGLPNTTLGLSNSALDDEVQILNLTISLDGHHILRSIVAEDVILKENVVYTFRNNGNYTIELRAANAISTVNSSVNVTVQHPVPTELQVTMATEKSSRPSCVPQNATIPDNVTTLLVFANETARFVASVSRGYNVTFDWSFGDGDAVTDEPFLEGCEERECRSSETNHIYKYEGKYTLNVTGYNEHGSAKHTVQLIVIRRVVTNLTLDVGDGEAGKDGVQNDRFLKVVSPFVSIQFLINVYTTDRQDTYLEIDHGDGNNDTYLLMDENGEYLGQREGGPDHISLLADYGRTGCLLSLALEHTFEKQGFYLSRAHVYNNNSDVQVELLKPVAVLSKLQGLKVQGDRSPAVGSRYEYMAEFSIVAFDVTYTWIVVSPSQEVVYNVSGTEQLLSYTFDERGSFFIRLTAQNPISFDDDEFYVDVHESIGEVTLELIGKKFVKRGDPVTFRATAESTNVKFEWDFHGPGNMLTQEDNRSWTATYTFDQAGAYSVDVNASNDFESKEVKYEGKIYVLDPIEILRVSTTSPTLAGNLTTITAEANGSNVKFGLKYNNTNQQDIHSKTRHEWSIKFSTGETYVTVIAENQVSNVSRTVVIEVEEGVDNKLTLTSSAETVQGEKVVFESRLGDSNVLSLRNDLLYIWSLNSEIKAYNTVPVYEGEFPKAEQATQEIFANVKVEVRNKVCDDCPSRAQKFSIKASSDTLRFIQGAVWEYPYPVNFSLVNLPLDCRSVHVKHGVKNESHSPVKANLTSGLTPFTWSYNYSSPGVYEVEANALTATAESKSVRTAITVQERIKDVRLKGPFAVPVHELSPKYEWAVTVQKGSHMLYEWYVGEKLVLRTPKPKLRWRFEEAGEYNINVRVSNSLGGENESSLVIAEYAVHKIELEALPVFRDDQVLINFTVHGGPMRKAAFNFDDGNITDFDEDAVVLDKEQIEGIATGQHGPTTRYFLNYRYKTVGSFELTVNVSNHVSWEVGRRSVIVEEPIGNINVTSVTKSIISLGSRVVVKATVESGQNLIFDWLITNNVEPDVESNNRSSTASFSLNNKGVYNVTVYVTNSRLQSVYKAAWLPYSIQVQESIAQLNVATSNQRKWAQLYRDKRGLWRTKAVNFTAWVNKGSDVTFYFNYGDGSTETVIGENRNDMVIAKTSHIYHKEGEFTVEVTASNLLGNTSTQYPFFVQIPPSSCALSSGRFNVGLGSFITINATDLSGSRVKFDWTMGDTTEYKDAGPSITHKFDAKGRYEVIVVCYNKVERKKANATVYVVSPITSVSVQVVGGQYQRKSTAIDFKAIVVPSTLKHDRSIKYVWSFGEMLGHWTDGLATMTKSYKNTGSYIVQVRSINAVSNKTSSVVVVDVIQPLSDVTLTLDGEHLVNRKLTFEAYHYDGSNVTYHWDFGDGTRRQTTLIRRIEHSYNMKRQYTVTVTASNKFSNKSASLSVFILHKPCGAPEVDSLIPTNSRLEVTRSQDFKLEYKVKINCSITSAANYTWTLRNSTTGEQIHLKNVPKEAFHDPILYLPRHTLNYGNYSVELMVAMQGTIVYRRKQTYFMVKPSNLLSIINGGIRRRVQRNETIVMDGSGSYDPDYKNVTDISYSWTCYKLLTSSSCFTDNALQDNTSKLLVLNGTSFNDTDGSKFVFNLTISRPRRKPAYSTQVLDLSRKGVIDLKLSCSECEYGSVNSDQRLILEAVHPGYKESELEYKWLFFLVVDGSDTSPATKAHDELSCVKADGSSYLRWPFNSKNDTQEERGEEEKGDQTSTSSTTSDASTISGSTRTSTTTRPVDIGGAPELNLNEGRPAIDGGRDPDVNPADPAVQASGRHIPTKEGSAPGQIGTMEEAHSGGRPSASSNGGRRRSDPSDTPGDGSDGTAIHASNGPSEGRGNPRGSGSGSSRGSGQQSGSSGSKTNSAGSLGGSGSSVADNTEAKRDMHIVSKGRLPTRISPSQTTTGLSQKALVIKKDVLKQGRTYIIEGVVTHRATRKEGTASAYVRINESPSQGQCYLRYPNPPMHGTEIETTFTITCLEWKDNDLPIQYEISYSLDNGASRDLIYQGLNHETTFKLPAGSPKLNNTVLVNIAILDKYGARTTVCSLPVTVLPQAAKTPEAEEEDLLNLVEQENSTLKTYVSKGDNRNARLHTQLVAHRLNRLHKKGNDSDNSIRAKIRTTLLSTLKDLPMRDKYEVQQTTSAVAASTAITDELCEESLIYASDILVKATERVTEISDVTKHVDRDIISVAIVGSSNIVAAASDPRVNGETAKPVVERTRWSIHNLTQTELNFTVLGEAPVKRETEHLFTYAGRFKTNQLPNIETSAANFTLPNNLNNVLERQITTKQGGNHGNQTRDCYEMHVVTYKQNPFLYGDGRRQQVQSQVASLALFACGGPELKIQDLPPSYQVVMTIPHLPEKVNNDLPTYVLHKHQMKVHQINVSLDPTDQSSTYMLLELEPVSQGRLFPIALLLRPNDVPTPTQFQYRRVFPANAEKLNFSLPPHSLNESITYYLGVVDANFNADRPRPGEVRERRYTLRIWKGECVFWDEQNDAWSSKGCRTSLTSTYTTTNCKCNHLTAFGTQLSLVPNDLKFDLDVDEFFDLNKNPVTVTLVACTFALYFVILVFCIMADKHDEKKGAIVHLLDNSTLHKHAYVITLETGMRRSAGTTAKVSFVLHGEEGMSETRELVSEHGQPLFERNSRDTFIMTLPETLGHIWKVQIWHNNAGPSPDWYLSRVIVNDIQKSKTFYFSCEKWFAVEEEDGKVEREIMSVEYGLGFAKVLWAKGTQYLTDYHLWFSMLARPSYSRFTRAQRLTCCLALIFSYMAVNAAWYRQRDPEYRGEVGLIDLSWRAVAVGAITSLLVLPVNLLLVFIFRRSKIKKVCIEDPPEKYFTGRRDSTTSLDSTVRLLQPPVTPSIFDQSMIHWASLQDWAQRQWTKRYQQEGTEESQDINKHGPDPMTFRNKHGAPECETDQTSSGIEDCIVHERTAGPAEEGRLPGIELRALSPIGGKREYSNIEQLSRQSSKRLSQDSELRWQQELDRYVLDAIRSRKSERLFLPYWCRYFAWALALSIIIVGAVITVLYGFRFGKAKSIAWLQSLFFSFLQCVFITHPVVVLLISVYTAIKYRNDLSIFDHHDDGVIEQRTNAMIKARQPKQEYDKDVDLAKGIAERQRSRYLRCARPPQEKQLIEARKNIMKQKKATSLLSDSLSAAVLLFLLIVVAYPKDNTTPYRLNSVLKDILTKSGSQPFDSVHRIEDWYRWSQSDMLDVLYWETWYNGEATTHEKGHVIGNSVIIGSISLRQLRVYPEKCHTPDPYHITKVCRHQYYYGSHDFRPFGKNGTWRYYDSAITRATGFTGKHAHYDGSGYQIILPGTRKEAYKLMTNLEAGKWLDQNTRGAMIEFTLYNAPTNIFTSVSLLLEMPPSGGPSTTSRIKSVYLFKYTTEFDNFILACELLLMVVTLYKLHCEIGELAWHKKNYFKNPWNTLEAAILILLLAYIACYLYRFVLVHEVVEILRGTYHEEFVDISYVAYWDEILKSFLGFIILLTVVKSLRLLRNRKVFSKFGGVYRKAGMEILCLACIMVIWLCAYTCLGYALYGAVSYNFSRIDTSLTTVVALLTGKSGFEEAEMTDRIGSQLFLISFLIFAVGSLTAYIVAVLTFHYRIYRDEGLPSLTTPEAFRYFWNKALQLAGFLKKLPEENEEQETKLPAEFTMAEIENQVDEMLFKMNALTGSSGLPEKAPDYITSDSDCTYGTGDDGISSGGSEVRPFDEVRLEHRLNKIEDNLMNMGNEAYLAQLLKLDSIGANVLSQEKENQLRSALEFEIFRQLQMQRGNNPDVQSLPSDNGQVIIHRLSSLSSASSSGSQGSSTYGTPVTMPTSVRKSREHLHKTRTEQDVLSLRSIKSKDSAHSGRTPTRGSRQSLSMNDGIKLQNLSEGASSATDDAIPLQDLVAVLMSPGKSEGDAESPPTSTVETRLLEDPVSTSSCSSGGAEIRYIVTQSHPRPHTVHSLPDASMMKGGAKPKHKNLAMLDKQLSYEHLYPDTSSGSERDAALRSSSKARSLRKTKSRGKGKGRSRLTLVDGIDELGLDNQGYTSESDHESRDGTLKSRHKQCWN